MISGLPACKEYFGAAGRPGYPLAEWRGFGVA
jgi:hypothetical protein